MKRQRVVILMMILLLTLSACGNHGSEGVVDNFFKIDRCNYEVSAKQFEFSVDRQHIRIEYPTFTFSGKDCTEINQLVENSLQNYINILYGNDISDLTLNANYELKYLSDEFSSIVIRGNSNVNSAAHPIRFAFAINISMDCKKIAEKSSIIPINEALAQQIIDFTKKQNNSAIEDYFNQFTLETMKDKLQEEDVFFYRSENDIWIIFPVPHPIGDYIEFKISMESTEDEGQGDGLREP